MGQLWLPDGWKTVILDGMFVALSILLLL